LENFLDGDVSCPETFEEKSSSTAEDESRCVGVGGTIKDDLPLLRREIVFPHFFTVRHFGVGVQSRCRTPEHPAAEPVEEQFIRPAADLAVWQHADSGESGLRPGVDLPAVLTELNAKVNEFSNVFLSLGFHGGCTFWEGMVIVYVSNNVCRLFPVSVAPHHQGVKKSLTLSKTI